MSPGPWQILIVILLVVVIFGANRVPHIMENLAKGINSFKRGLKEGDEDLRRIGSDKGSSGVNAPSSKVGAKAGDDE